MKVFSINGHYNDDHESFNGYLVAELDNTPKGYSDDQIFFYGLSESDIKYMINNPDDQDDFTITNYELVGVTQ